VYIHLLSDEVWIVGCLHLEGAVVRPQVDRIGDVGASPLIDLAISSASCANGDTAILLVLIPSRLIRGQQC
jgi:hypothetical protein